MILSKVKKASVKKILSELKKLKKKDKEKFLEFSTNFGKVLKEGIMGEFENRDALLDLIMFKTTKSGDEFIDFETYKERMKEDQKEIYYLMGEDESMLKNSPLLEDYRDRDVEVILFGDEVDSIVVPQIGSYKETPLTAINHVKVDGDDETVKKLEEEYGEVIVKMKELLKDGVKDVKISPRLKSSPSCLIYDKDDPDFTMMQMLKQMGQTNLPNVKPILEINPEHPIFKKIKEKNDFVKLEKVTPLILDLAKLNEGMKLNDSAEFTKNIANLIEESL